MTPCLSLYPPLCLSLLVAFNWQYVLCVRVIDFICEIAEFKTQESLYFLLNFFFIFTFFIYIYFWEIPQMIFCFGSQCKFHFLKSLYFLDTKNQILFRWLSANLILFQRFSVMSLVLQDCQLFHSSSSKTFKTTSCSYKTLKSLLSNFISRHCLSRKEG